jgi:hypothetical protein
VTQIAYAPGDVLVMAVTGDWKKNATRWFIELQSKLTGRTAPQDHVAILSHQDASGNWWCIEGKPSSVGYVLAKKYLEHPSLVTNVDQPKTDEQRALIVQVAKEMLGAPYDWSAIITLGARAARVNQLWDRLFARHWGDWDDDEIPVHVICSSLADLAYEKAGLVSPGGTRGTRFTRPADWTHFCQRRLWETVA